MVRYQKAFFFLIVPLIVVCGQKSFTSISYADETDRSKGITPPKIFESKLPNSINDLIQIEKHIKFLYDKVSPCVVNIRIDDSEGSGVVISEDGFILTAGHVIRRPNKNARIIFPDGKTAEAKTLGINEKIDSGMLKLKGEKKWKFVEMGDTNLVHPGQWAMALGHPNGYKANRPPVVRVGRILTSKNTVLDSDCALVGGDSGGPLFDMAGKVIGIHSRIGDSVSNNFHVAINTYKDTWDRLKAGEHWNLEKENRFVRKQTFPYAGFSVIKGTKGIQITKIEKDSPAEKAKLKENDVILMIEDENITAISQIRKFIFGTKPGSDLAFTIQRGTKEIYLSVTIGKTNEKPKGF